MHDFFEGFEVNRLTVPRLELTYDSLPFSLLLSLLHLACLLLFFLGIFGLLVTPRVDFDLPGFGFRQLEVLDQSLDRDHSAFGNRVECTMKVLLAH